MPVYLNGSHTAEEIADALKIIKETCQSADNCVTCPLYADNEEGCGIYNDGRPADWVINPPGKWKAF